MASTFTFPHHPAAAAPPRLIAWELTRSCPLRCRHCRAGDAPAGGELSTEECRRVIDGLAGWCRPTLILTGGEPLSRPDVYDIAAHAASRGLKCVLATCGGPLDEAAATRLLSAGVRKVSISLDGASAASHDAWRGVPGAFDAALRGIQAARRAGLAFQVNTTITRRNRAEVPAILGLAAGLGADVFNPFLLVPTGRGAALAEEQLSAQEYEDLLRWLAAQRGRQDIRIRVTCAPHYQRIAREVEAASGRFTCSPGPEPKRQDGLHVDAASSRIGKRQDAASTGGCLGGKSFAFIGVTGVVQICGFLDVPCGDLRREGLDFRKVWEESEVLRKVRDVDGYRGRCGVCEYRRVCGGCRARAHAMGGDYLGEEPLCTHQPAPGAAGGAAKAVAGERRGAPADAATTKSHAADAATANVCEAALDELDRRILTDIQADFPIVRLPYEVIAGRMGCTSEEVLARVVRLSEAGVIRRLGGVFSGAHLGYVSTLVAAKVAPAKMDAVAAEVSRLEGVTHNYAREHAYNLWFTVTARSAEALRRTVEGLRALAGVEDMKSLPGALSYKTSAVFVMDRDVGQVISVNKKTGEQSPAGSPSVTPATKPVSITVVPLDERQKALVRLVQESLPLDGRPLVSLARQWSGPVELLIVTLRHWLATGVLRRFGAVLAHRRVGLSANGLAMFRVPAVRADAAGAILSARSEVSHCYLRESPDGWPWNLFAMFHGRDRESVAALVRRLAEKAGLGEHEVVFSTVEYKKTSPRFFLEGP